MSEVEGEDNDGIEFQANSEGKCNEYRLFPVYDPKDLGHRVCDIQTIADGFVMVFRIRGLNINKQMRIDFAIKPTRHCLKGEYNPEKLYHLLNASGKECQNPESPTTFRSGVTAV